MRGREILRGAVRSLWRAPVRSGLTALGVIVGVAAVLTTSSIGNGARVKIQEALARPESRTIFLIATVPRVPGRQRPLRLPFADSLRPADYHALRESVHGIAAASPRIYLPDVHVRASGKDIVSVLEGLDVEGFDTSGRRLLAGTLFGPRDLRDGASVCVLSESLAKALLGAGPYVGRKVRFNDPTFLVVGVVDDDVSGEGRTAVASADLRAYVPFTTLASRVDHTAQMTINMQANSMEEVGFVQQQIDDAIEQRRGGRKAVFRTVNAAASIKSYADGSTIVTRMLAVLGAVALLVGGIGIMNVMLFSVNERTREIGLRMAIGTRARYILAQFLSEALALSFMGGSLGVVLGCAVTWVVGEALGWPTRVTAVSIVVALFCSIVVGAAFGYTPARRAAWLAPVEALRAD
jgi:putative ABC transport system permease protein